MSVISWITVLALSAIAVPASAAAPSKKFTEVAVWAGPNAKSDPRVVSIYDHHACSGQVAVVRLERMPSWRPKARLEPELVVELSETGRIVRRWAMPVDSSVAAVDGDRIIVPILDETARGKSLIISSTGNLSVSATPQGANHGRPVDCPRIREFGDSAYLRCFDFADLTTMQTRRIGYQGPCT